MIKHILYARQHIDEPFDQLLKAAELHFSKTPYRRSERHPTPPSTGLLQAGVQNEVKDGDEELLDVLPVYEEGVTTCAQGEEEEEEGSESDNMFAASDDDEDKGQAAMVEKETTSCCTRLQARIEGCALDRDPSADKGGEDEELDVLEATDSYHSLQSRQSRRRGLAPTLDNRLGAESKNESGDDRPPPRRQRSVSSLSKVQQFRLNRKHQRVLDMANAINAVQQCIASSCQGCTKQTTHSRSCGGRVSAVSLSLGSSNVDVSELYYIIFPNAKAEANLNNPTTSASFDETTQTTTPSLSSITVQRRKAIRDLALTAQSLMNTSGNGRRTSRKAKVSIYVARCSEETSSESNADSTDVDDLCVSMGRQESVKGTNLLQSLAKESAWRAEAKVPSQLLRSSMPLLMFFGEGIFNQSATSYPPSLSSTALESTSTSTSISGSPAALAFESLPLINSDSSDRGVRLLPVSSLSRVIEQSSIAKSVWSLLVSTSAVGRALTSWPGGPIGDSQISSMSSLQTLRQRSTRRIMGFETVNQRTQKRREGGTVTNDICLGDNVGHKGGEEEELEEEEEEEMLVPHDEENIQGIGMKRTRQSHRGLTSVETASSSTMKEDKTLMGDSVTTSPCRKRVCLEDASNAFEPAYTDVSLTNDEHAGLHNSHMEDDDLAPLSELPAHPSLPRGNRREDLICYTTAWFPSLHH